MKRRYFFDQDDSGHWYLVPEDRRGEWEAWLTSDEMEQGVEPEWVTRLAGGVQQVTFAYPSGGGV